MLLAVLQLPFGIPLSPKTFVIGLVIIALFIILVAIGPTQIGIQRHPKKDRESESPPSDPDPPLSATDIGYLSEQTRDAFSI